MIVCFVYIHLIKFKFLIVQKFNEIYAYIKSAKFRKNSFSDLKEFRFFFPRVVQGTKENFAMQTNRDRRAVA